MNKRKTTSIALAAAVAISTVQLAYPANVFAHENVTKVTTNSKEVLTNEGTKENPWDASVNSDNSIQVYLEKNNNDAQNPTYKLIINGTGEMKDYKNANEVPWNTYLNQVTEGIVKEGITHLGDRTFVLASKLTKVSLPNTLKSTGWSSFAQTGISTIELPDSLETIGKYTFYRSNLSKIEIPNSVKNINDHAFNGSKLTEVTLPEGLKTLGGGAFANTPLKKCLIYL